MKKIEKILIVCTGNSCRSIMAEAYLLKRLKEKKMDNVEVLSAGTHASGGMNPTDEVIKIMADSGIDVSAYTSSPLNKVHIDNADVILIMSRIHMEKILNLSPDTLDKIHYLREFSGEIERKSNRISDPIGRPLKFYKEIFELIKDCMEGFLEWINE